MHWTPGSSCSSPASPGSVSWRRPGGSASHAAPCRRGSTGSIALGRTPRGRPQADPAAIGFPVAAFATLEIAQAAGHGPVAEHLRTIPEVLEAHTITGGADMMVRLVARSNSDLQRVIDQVVAAPSVRRASTVIALTTEIAPRVTPLVQSLSAT